MEISFSVMWERWEGTIEYTFMAPVRRLTHLLGVCAFAIGYGLTRTLVVLAISVPLFHLDLSHANAVTALTVLVVSTFPLVGLGVLASVLPLLSPERGEQMTVAVQGILLLASGVYYPISVLPGPVQLMARASPMTYTLDGIRAALIDGRGLGPVAPDLLALVVMGVLLLPLGVLAFGWAERRAKRLGLLKRSG
jgi:ABC-2 type transport system permease protein